MLLRDLADGLNLQGSGQAIFQLDTLEQGINIALTDNSLDLDEIALDQAIGRMSRSMGNIPIVGQKD